VFGIGHIRGVAIAMPGGRSKRNGTAIGKGPSNPSHGWRFAGLEWFSNEGTTTASVTYDLGRVQVIDAVALWNDDASGIGVLDLFGSVNGTDFFTLAMSLTPVDNPLGVDYLPEVFSFSATVLQYIRFDMSGCPQPLGDGFEACAIGEVAFRAGIVPIPAAVWLFASAIAGLGLARRRR